MNAKEGAEQGAYRAGAVNAREGAEQEVHRAGVVTADLRGKNGAEARRAATCAAGMKEDCVCEMIMYMRSAIS